MRVEEARIDPHALRDRCERELADSGVDLRLGTHVEDPAALEERYAVVAAYAALNDLLDGHGSLVDRYKFELYEKPVVDLPRAFSDTSVVVMDGPFMCFDPYGRTGHFLLGNVVHSIHDRQVGLEPSFDDRYETLVDAGLVESPEPTNVDAILASGSEFFPRLTEAEHLGSLFTVRAVPACVEDTDERPTVVEREGDVVKLFSGKLGTCVDAARAVVAELGGDAPTSPETVVRRSHGRRR